MRIGRGVMLCMLPELCCLSVRHVDNGSPHQRVNSYWFHGHYYTQYGDGLEILQPSI
jgi:hypothetical protein